MTRDPHPFSSPADAAADVIERLVEPAVVLVAVSGGSDSLGLLLACHEAAAQSGRRVTLVAATVDHGLRAEAAAEARAVAEVCSTLTIPHRIMRWEADKPVSALSAAAREARYRLLSAAAEELGADAIITGHTADDQAETYAMRASRTASEDNLGLAGMAEAVLLQGKIWLLRPFLNTRRKDIRSFLRERGREWIDDPSNLDPSYERARLRISAQPLSADIMDTVRAAGVRRRSMSGEAAELAGRHLALSQAALATLPLQPLWDCDAHIVRHLLATLAAVLGGRTHLPAAVPMARVTTLLQGRRPARTTIARVVFDFRRDHLFMCRENRGLGSLHVGGGEMLVWDGRHRICNRSNQKITVGPTPPDRKQALVLFPQAPPAVAMRAMNAMPLLVAAPKQEGAAVSVEPVLAPFDRFLPQFDLTLAQQLGVLFGCDIFPAPPIKVSMRKS